MEIIEYINANNITIKFLNSGFIKYNTTWRHFNSGNIRDPYHPSIYDRGYIGEGEYKAIKRNTNKCYIVWNGMLRRCHDKEYHKKEPTYVGCAIYDEWLNFQNFAKWYDKNYYEINNERMALDKDILIKGNKLYSPETCIFVPQRINSLFTSRRNFRGELPIGVYYRNKKFWARCNDGSGKDIYLGNFNNKIDAFNAYKEYKEKLIRQVAEEYKNKIPEKLYNAMYRWKVEITD